MYEIKAKNSFFVYSVFVFLGTLRRVVAWGEGGEGGAVATAGAGVGGKINILNKKIFSTFTAKVLY